MIHIIADYYFSADGVQYTLYRKWEEGRKYKTFGEIKGYFTTLDHLLDRLAEIITAENSTDGEIAEYIQALESNKKMLENLEQVKAKEHGDLTDRPCEVCKHHSENGCTEWKCIFEGA